MLEPDNPYAQEFARRRLGRARTGSRPSRRSWRTSRCAPRSGAGRPARGRGRGRAAGARSARVAVPLVPNVPDGVLDLSVRGDVLRFGDWAEPADQPARARAAAGGGIGRWGEGRLVHARPEQWDPPASVHLGADVFVDVGTPVSAPVAATVTRVGAWDVTLDCDGTGIRLAGIAPAVQHGQRRRRGRDRRHRVGARAADPLPAHLHVQAVAEPRPRRARPRHARRTPRAGWRCAPTPRRCSGRDCAAPRDDPATLVGRRDAVFARVQEHYYEEPPQIERGWRHHLVRHRRPRLPRHGQQRRRPGALAPARRRRGRRASCAC